MKATIKTATVVQPANEVLGTKEKKLHYLIIENDKGGKKIINVGEGTIEDIKNLGDDTQTIEGETNTGDKVDNKDSKRGRGNGGNN